MKELILTHVFLSVVLMAAGMGLYFLLSYLLEIPGSKKIDVIYETAQEAKERKARKKKITRKYTVCLVWLVILINLIFYYL